MNKIKENFTHTISFHENKRNLNFISLDEIPRRDWSKFIGDGYRSVTYSLKKDKKNKVKGEVVLFGFSPTGERKEFYLSHESILKYNVNYKTETKDVFGRYVAEKRFPNIFERKKFLNKYPDLPVLECLNPSSEVLRSLFETRAFDENFNKFPLRIQYFDLESEISESFMFPVDAENRINMITIFDSELKKFHTWSLQNDARIDFKNDPLKDYPIDMFELEMFADDEKSLLESFLTWTENNYPDVYFGWNVSAYDMPYLIRRIENVLGKNDAARISPVGSYSLMDASLRSKKIGKANPKDIIAKIDGIFISDGLILYRDKFKISGGNLDGGYSLDNVGEHENLGKKISFEGTLKDLYLNNYQLFYEYNVRDVDLAKKIDEKCGLTALSRKISSFGLTDYNSIYSSISYLIGSVSIFAKNHAGGKVFPSYLKNKNVKHEQFEGAFIFPISPSVWRDGVGCIDFRSLYPSNIIVINASPETYVGKVIIRRKTPEGNFLSPNLTNEPYFDIFDDSIAKNPEIVGFEILLINGQRKKFTLEQLRKIILEKCIYTVNNTLFLRKDQKEGVVPKWCSYFQTLRRKAKKEIKSIKAKLKKDPENPNELNLRLEYLNILQLAIKTMINSMFGCFGTPYSPIYNLNIAQSITRQGKFCNISSSEFIAKYFKDKFGTKDGYIQTIGGDTDSVTGDSKLMVLF